MQPMSLVTPFFATTRWRPLEGPHEEFAFYRYITKVLCLIAPTSRLCSDESYFLHMHDLEM